MFLTGFADEAAKSIEGQIKATQELGWRNIEARNVDGVNIHDMDENAFERLADLLDEAGIHVNCFGSTIANWGKQIDQPFDSSLAEAHRAIPRMKRLGTNTIRLMSFAVLKDRDPEDQMEQERFRRLRELTAMFLDAGIQPLHENCMNYGGMGFPYTLRLIENVPGLKLVFDTGNPVFAENRTLPHPRPRQSSREFYLNVKPFIEYVHIKDGRYNEGETTHTFAGEGDGDTRFIVQDLLESGYDGGFSMEPHMSVVFHDQAVQSDDEIRFANYVEYGRRFMQLISELGYGHLLS